MTEDNSKQDYFVNTDGIKLFRKVFQSGIDSVKAVVFLCHGLFEHCDAEYYETIIKPLNNIGCMVIAHDHKGHGRSEGERGRISDLQSLVRDVLLDIDDVIKSSEIPETTPVFLYGHSMGGLIAVHAVLQNSRHFHGMCLEGPFLALPEDLGKITLFFARMVNRILPTYPAAKLKYEEICRNTEYIEQVKLDQLRIHTSIPLQIILELLNAVDVAKVGFKDITVPFIIGHGEADTISVVGGSRALMESCPIEDKTLITYPDAKHQLRKEIENVDVEFKEKIVEWFGKKINENVTQ